MSSPGDLYDDLNRALAGAEERLLVLGIRVAASVPLDSGRTLSFRKHDGKWGLWVEDSEGVAALLKSSMADRLTAAGELTNLYQAIVNAAGNLTEATRGAIRLANGFLVGR